MQIGEYPTYLPDFCRLLEDGEVIQEMIKIVVKQNNKPTKPGFYFYRVKGFPLVAVEVVEAHGRLQVLDRERNDG